MRTIICFGDRTSGTFPIITSVTRTKITQSHGLITLWMRLFSTVLFTSSRALTYRKSKLCKKLIYETIAALITCNASHLG